MNTTRKISNFNKHGIMRVKTLEDGCIYQEVFFGAAICAYYGNSSYYDNYKRMELETSQLFKKEIYRLFQPTGIL
ncbi:MAG: hypothetical protein F6K40_26250 [Okeania sp. SIO3I5]|uniref:hypothetical protein n=1 Tax=Okeania sp. SIO3I5 TaxID=2607805 RepID=UPI0013B6E416|nr:hypothetical protein [Okeania sp. SIO3I5]NEQ39567.1 hypothetical protein [Okeania sp. SIO3I5]